MQKSKQIENFLKKRAKKCKNKNVKIFKKSYKILYFAKAFEKIKNKKSSPKNRLNF